MSGVQSSPRNMISQKKRLSQSSSMSEAKSEKADYVSNPCASPLSRPALGSPGTPPVAVSHRDGSISSSSSKNTLSVDGAPSRIPKPPIRAVSHGSKPRINGGSSLIRPPNTFVVGTKKPSVTLETLNSSFPLDSFVETTNDKFSGRLRYLGPIKGKEGIWAGIELEEKGSGKNDGTANGDRYFTCPENSGVFVSATLLRLSTRANRAETKPVSKSLQSGRRPLKAKSIPNGPRPSSLVVTSSTDKVLHSSLLVSSASSAAISKIVKDVKQPVKPRPNLGPSTTSDNAPSAKSKLPSSAVHTSKNDLDDLDNDFSEYLNANNSNPTLVIQSLVSQLHSLRKQNELLQVRINKKRAHTEATRVLRTEFIDRARQEVMSRRLSKPNASDTPKLEDINSRIASCDEDIKLILARTEERLAVEPSHEPGSEGELTDELKKRISDLHLIHTELQNLHRHLLTRDDLLNQLKEELSQPHDQSTSPKLADILAELDALKRDSSQEISSLKEEIERLKATEVPSSEVEALKQQLAESEARVQSIEKLSADAESKSHAECMRLSEEVKRLTAEREINQNDPRLVENEELIKKLQEENLELQEALEEFLDEENANDPPMDLQEELEKQLDALKEAQNEKNNMAAQIQALKSALTQMEASQGPAPPEFPRASEEDSARVADLEQQIVHLEDELVKAKAFSDKLRQGNFTEKDLHDSLVAEVESRDQYILQLETDLKELSNQYRQLTEANDQLMADAQALEDDNWRIDDMYKEMQEEMERVMVQFNESKEKVKLLTQALDAASATSDSAFKVKELMFKCEEFEAGYRGELDGLIKLADEQEEEIIQLTEREKKLEQEVETLQKQLAKAKRGGILDDALDDLDADVLDQLDDLPFCHICCETGHEPEACPIPPPEDDVGTLDGLEDLESSLREFNLDLEPLEKNLICSDCQQTGHLVEDCPISSQNF
ncbi:Translation initiation factor 3 subunit c [Entomophthora muscae]|uniref:Translation initiation factor 3 subunit c n=1 Tax=Entomophthora muscae TaxID=34485 RepID=A0ACC2SDQ8_9FUNG|nr:Translation initiation factor 3 subunit c [Entomophthora muscae]